MSLSKRRAVARKDFLERRANAMRRKPTPPEKELWGLLHLVQDEMDWHWKAQYICEHEGFILDFYEPKARICIEVDGQHHVRDRNQREKDVLRDGTLEIENIEVIRIPAYRLQKNAMGVLENIVRTYRARTLNGSQRRPSQRLAPETRSSIRTHNSLPIEERLAKISNPSDQFAQFKRSKKPF